MSQLYSKNKIEEENLEQGSGNKKAQATTATAAEGKKARLESRSGCGQDQGTAQANGLPQPECAFAIGCAAKARERNIPMCTEQAGTGLKTPNLEVRDGNLP